MFCLLFSGLSHAVSAVTTKISNLYLGYLKIQVKNNPLVTKQLGHLLWYKSKRFIKIVISESPETRTTQHAGYCLHWSTSSPLRACQLKYRASALSRGQTHWSRTGPCPGIGTVYQRSIFLFCMTLNVGLPVSGLFSTQKSNSIVVVSIAESTQKYLNCLPFFVSVLFKKSINNAKLCYIFINVCSRFK